MHLVSLQNPDYLFSRFCVCGISYQKTDASTRGLFHLDDETKILILVRAKELGIRSIFILSTCNRTEIYAYAPNAQMVIDLFNISKNIDKKLLLEKHCYQKIGESALQHLFSVAAGLDSQILGDYEILGQLKQSIVFSQKLSMIGPIMDRTINFTLQASKKVKTTTALSSGTTSVSFASIEWLKKNIHVSGKKIALIGLGKFGSTVGKNLKQYFPEAFITVCNRTNGKALAFAEAHKLKSVSYEQVGPLVNDSDIIIVSTHSADSTVLAQHITDVKSRIFLDLSIPGNIDRAIAEIPLQRIVDVDDISVILNNTLEGRRKEVPKAKMILHEMQSEFMNWLSSYSHAPLVKKMKEQLQVLSQLNRGCEMADQLLPDDATYSDANCIKKTISRLAINLRTKNEKGCQLIEAYNHFLNYHPGA